MGRYRLGDNPANHFKGLVRCRNTLCFSFYNYLTHKQNEGFWVFSEGKYVLYYIRRLRSYTNEYRQAKKLFDELHSGREDYLKRVPEHTREYRNTEEEFSKINCRKVADFSDILEVAAKKTITNYLKKRSHYNYYEALEIVEQFMAESGIRKFCSTLCKGTCCGSCKSRGDNGCKLKVRNLLCSIHTCPDVRFLFTSEEQDTINEVYDTIDSHLCAILDFRYYFDVTTWDGHKEDLEDLRKHPLQEFVRELGYNNPSAKIFPASIGKLKILDTEGMNKRVQEKIQKENRRR